MKRVLIERNRYFDSVFLMRINRELEQLPEVHRAIVAMGTRANLDNLKAAGFAIDESAPPILPHDVVIAIDGTSEQDVDEANDHLRLLLTGRTVDEGGPADASRPMTLSEAIRADPDINLALISVPGAYAAREARQALRHGLHVMLFSDNVSVEDEISLKDEAIGRDLLMMGPDCGTAILNGIPLGFANVVRRGSIGIVGASGTGIQEISSLVHRFGGGISQAIGTGGRDLSGAVGARMTLLGIEALANDPETDVIIVVSKAPEPTVARRVIDALRTTGKPSVVQFVAGGPKSSDGAVSFAETLAGAARLSCEMAEPAISRNDASPRLPDLKPSATRRFIRGLYCGGTLAQEAWDILSRCGLDVRSNVAADPTSKIDPGAAETGHVIWDLGDDAFTVGRPHPMIAPSLRDGEVLSSAKDRSVGIVLADCVLGYGAHPDPAGSLADAARRAIESARKDGRDLLVIASVTGTDGDPQNLSRQVAALTGAGVLVAPSNAAAARWVVEAMKGAAG
jgi:FdrA protein